MEVNSKLVNVLLKDIKLFLNVRFLRIHCVLGEIPLLSLWNN